MHVEQYVKLGEKIELDTILEKMTALAAIKSDEGLSAYLEKYENVHFNGRDKYDESKMNKYTLSRKKKMEAALKKIGLVLREDSYYCHRYIFYNRGSVEDIANRMEEVDFLYSGAIEHEDSIAKIRSVVMKEMKDSGKFYPKPIYKQKVLEGVERIILGEKSYGDFKEKMEERRKQRLEASKENKCEN